MFPKEIVSPLRAGIFPCALDRVTSKDLSMGHVEDITLWDWNLETFICQNNFTVSIAGSKQNSIWKPKGLCPAASPVPKFSQRWKEGFWWGCTKKRGFGKDPLDLRLMGRVKVPTCSQILKPFTSTPEFTPVLKNGKVLPRVLFSLGEREMVLPS